MFSAIVTNLTTALGVRELTEGELGEVSISLRSVSLLRGYDYGGQGSSVSKLGIRCKHESTAHRDGSPYILRSRQMARAKPVGRTVSVSRRGNFAFFRAFRVFRGENC